MAGVGGKLTAAFICLLAVYWYWTQPRGKVRIQLDTHYDYIIVGAGTAGCVVASRLSEDASVTVLVLEAGDEEFSMPSTAIPSQAFTQSGSSADWKFTTTPQKHSAQANRENRILMSQGKILGGSSSINAMMYVRGNRHDYDAWAQMGCEGWSYKDVLPYFKKSENTQEQELKQSEYHGTDGPLFLSYNYHPPIDEVLLQAAQELGHKLTDHNGEHQEGVQRQYNIMHGGKRYSSATAFLRPAMERDNLHVATLAQVTKVLFDGGVAVGVEFIRNGMQQQVRARREVILSAGVYNSPHILMLSGIGPKQQLQAHNIPVITDLPVGQWMEDHPMTEAVQFKFDHKVAFTGKEEASTLAQLQFLFGKGPSSVYKMFTSVYMKAPSQPQEDDFPYLQIVSAAFNIGTGDEATRKATSKVFLYNEEIFDAMSDHIEEGYSVTLFIFLLHPVHQGSVRLASNNPNDKPLIDPNLLAHPRDVKILVEGIRASQAFVNTTTMKSLGATLVTRHHPSCQEHQYDSDIYWECYLRHSFLSNAYHGTGTCRMGPTGDPMAVVDPQLRVHGIPNLRIIDNSIIPKGLSGPTCATAFMIGEKGADLIKRK